MKEDIVDFILLLVSLTLIGFGLYHINRPIEEPQPVIVDHYIDRVKTDTIWLDRYDTLEYFNIDTIYEGGEIIIVEDTLQIPVPISKSIFSDTLKTDTTKFSYRMLVEGYNVAIDSLSYHFEYNPPKIQKKSQQRLFFGLAVGVTYYEGVKPCIGLGIGYRLF